MSALLQGVHAVTGGGRGIGRAIAARLAEMGASLTLLGRDPARLHDAAKELPQCDAHACDVGDAVSVRHAFAAIARAAHHIAILVNIASTAGLIGYRQVAACCAAKHGVIGLALEFAATRVTVNAVCPGYTDAGLIDVAVSDIVAKTGRNAAAARELLAARNPQKRLVTPEEVAAAVAWLCLPESGAITGQAISVSGGEVTAG